MYFSALNSSVLTGCTWTFGDGAAQTLTPPDGQIFQLCPSVTHTYTSTGSFTVSLSVTKSTGRSNSMTKTDYIQIADAGTPTPTITPRPSGTPTPTRTPTSSSTPTSVPGADFSGSPLLGAAPLDVQFDALNASILSSCTWNFGDGTQQTLTPPAGQTFPVCPSVTHTYTSIGTFDVVLSVVKVTGQANSLTRTNYVRVTDGPTPTPTPTPSSIPGANFTGSPLSGLAPLTVRFDGLDTNILSLCSWTFGNGYGWSDIPPSGQTFQICPSVTYTYASAGSYKVSLCVIRATNGQTNCLTKTNYVQVSAASTPTPTWSTPTITPTPSRTPTPTWTLTCSSEPCHTPTRSLTPTPTRTPTRTLTVTRTPTRTLTATRTASPTATPVYLLQTFVSSAVQDGWVLETSQTSRQGGTLDAAGATLRVGDDAHNRQYRSLLSFNTAGLPDTAVIVSLQLKLQKQGVTGTDPFTTHGKLLVDVRRRYFGTLRGLEPLDFQAAANLASAGSVASVPVGAYFVSDLSKGAFAYLNRAGLTQLRLRFALDDDNDLNADILSFYSGDAAAAYRPLLEVRYFIPALPTPTAFKPITPTPTWTPVGSGG